MIVHPQKFRIIGFFDKGWKWHGTEQCTHFREEDCFVSDHIPTTEQLREYATEKGYYPSPKVLGAPNREGRCDVIYEMVGDGFEWLNCPICKPGPHEVIDNRTGGA